MYKHGQYVINVVQNSVRKNPESELQIIVIFKNKVSILVQTVPLQLPHVGEHFSLTLCMYTL